MSMYIRRMYEYVQRMYEYVRRMYEYVRRTYKDGTKVFEWRPLILDEVH